MPRPSLPDARKRSRIISFRVNESDYSRLASKASKADLRLNDFVRQLTLSRSDNVTFKSSSALNPAFIKQLQAIGNNLNQLVKNAHIFGRISPKIEPLCERIAVIIDKAIEDS